eukprot:CAMPEP_0117448188 /NCGR_PEP_ID=MMETSP0759-20121206/7271_1 /TAXON_ID=63605 /ORGANISM="Percolomonas cosmopolitus, Strain WS" /LENGTH=276 /DNA_ID=CAMNT_0005240565 /DNA_START=107 /DNA_END=937 /DNA_ORIENTATION=+
MSKIFRHYNLRNLTGLFLRDAAKFTDSLGAMVMGKASYAEQLNRSRRLTKLGDYEPVLSDPASTFIAPNAQVMGEVEMGKNVSVWYGTILRADANRISVDNYTNLQDRCLVRGTDELHRDFQVALGKFVTVESGVTLKGCLIEDNCFVGVGATILEGVEIGKGSMIAPGSLVTPGTMIGDGEFWAGSPARKVRDLTKKEIEQIKDHAYLYFDLAMKHKEETDKSFEQVAMEQERQAMRLAKLSQMLPATHAREWPREFHQEDPNKRRAAPPPNDQQ